MESNKIQFIPTRILKNILDNNCLSACASHDYSDYREEIEQILWSRAEKKALHREKMERKLYDSRIDEAYKCEYYEITGEMPSC